MQFNVFIHDAVYSQDSNPLPTQQLENHVSPKPDGRTDGRTDISNYRVASLLISLCFYKHL